MKNREIDVDIEIITEMENSEMDVYVGLIDCESNRSKLEMPIDINKDDMMFDTNLNDLNVDCQESIFQYLNLSDLLNISETDDDFTEAANIIYRRLYKNKLIRIDKNVCGFGHYPNTHTIKSGCIIVHNQRFYSRLLSNFGNSIKKLSINLKMKNYFNEIEDIQAQINKYCAKSLVEFNIENCQHFTSKAFVKPFSQVCALSLTNCVLQFTADEFNRLFPCLIRLELLKNKMKSEHSVFIEQNFPNLKHWTLDHKGFSRQNILMALFFNQQLSSLHLMTTVDSKFLHLINELSPNLRNLQLVISSYDFTEDFSINFKNVEKMKLSVHGPFKNLPINFDQLKELEINVNDGYYHGFIDFIIQNVNLIKLTIDTPCWIVMNTDDIDVKLIGQNLNLTELSLKRCRISDDAASYLMNSGKLLKKLQFRQMDPTEQLELNINKDKWKVDVDHGLVQCELR